MRRELFRLSDTLSSRRNDLHKLQSSLETLDYRESSSVRDKEGIAGNLLESKSLIAELSGEIEGRRSEISRLHEEKEEMNAEISRLREDIENKKVLLSTGKAGTGRQSLQAIFTQRTYCGQISIRVAC